MNIQHTGELLAKAEYKALEAMEQQYWEMHEEIAKASYPSRWEQLKDLELLAQFALALKAKADSYSAINIVRCN